jgi:hypothetical protein
MADGLDPERVLQALARPGVGDELHALGVRDLSGFGPAEVYIPPEHVARVRELVEAEEAEPAAEDQPKLDERAERWRIPYDSFWYILEQRVKRGKLAKVSTLAERTRRSRRLTFVGRTRVAHVVEWIEAHPEQAERALALHEIPAGFRANEHGVLVPKTPNPASRHASR